MARSHDKLDISPGVIDLGTTVIQLSHVVSAGYGTTHPYRPLGLLSLAGGLGLIGYQFAMQGVAAFAVKGGGAPLLWLAFGALGIGMFLVAFARRRLIIRTSDGQRTQLSAGDDAVVGSIVAQIREAMENVAQPGLEGAPAARALPTRAVLAQQPTQPVALGQPPARAPIAAQPAAITMAEPALRAEPYVNGAAGRPLNGTGLREPLSAAEAAAIAQRRHLSQLPPSESAHGGEPRMAGVAPHQGGQAYLPTTRERPSLPQTMPAGGLQNSAPRDLAALIEHVRAAEVQHKEALLELLRVVDDYYQGRASREDAVAHWRSFADYVAQYLGDIEGLLMLTERFGRHMLAGR